MSRLYCGNSECGTYLGSMGADSCGYCGWIDPEEIESAATEPLLQRIAELEHQLEEAQDAAKRYTFLRDLDHWPAPFASSQAPEPVRGADLDAAIDNAMKKENL